MRIAIMGAGAVGCYYGAMLARAGCPVALVARRRHADAVNERGLLLERADFAAHVPVAATTEPSGVAGADVVLFCVKSSDSRAAALAMAPHLKEGATVLSLQNGVENVEALQSVLPRGVVRAVVFVAAEMAGDGHVRHNGRGELTIGPSPHSEAIARTFGAAGIPVTVSPDVLGVAWRKLVVNCSWNALSALTQMPYGPLGRSEGVPGVIAAVVGECAAVAAADGVAIPADYADTVIASTIDTMPDQRSSTAQDLARGKQSEIGFLNGYVVRRGAELGVATPVNLTLQTLVRLAEGRADRTPGAGTAEARRASTPAHGPDHGPDA